MLKAFQEGSNTTELSGRVAPMCFKEVWLGREGLGLLCSRVLQDIEM